MGLCVAKHFLSMAYSSLGQYGNAKELQEEVQKLRMEVLGKHHPHTITASSNLAVTYCDLGKLEKALQLR